MLKKVFRKVFRVAVYLAVFILLIVISTWGGYLSGTQVVFADSASLPDHLDAEAPHPYDASKPTIAILLGSQWTEVTDFLIPYEVFSAAGAFNVYAVAPQRQLNVLKGGLDVLPDYSLDGLDKMLGKSPDIIVVPNIDENQPAISPSILNWLRHHASKGSQMLSICVGARTLAEAGLLDGHRATTHWGYIDLAEQKFPNVKWQRGLRYVDDGTVITSAGITSGLDASLYVVAQRLGQPAAERIANDLHYPDFAFVTHPQVEQYHSAQPDSIVLMNMLLKWQRANDGVLLYNGVGEIELASVFDTYAGSFTMRTSSVAPTRQWVTTKHGLHLLPRYDYNTAPALDRLLIPGQDARQLAQAGTAAWTARHSTIPIVYVHADLPDHFAYDAPLLDLARNQNAPIAQAQARGLEYRPPALELSGAGWPWLLPLQPVLVGLAGILLLFVGQRAMAALSSPKPAR